MLMNHGGDENGGGGDGDNVDDDDGCDDDGDGSFSRMTRCLFHASGLLIRSGEFEFGFWLLGGGFDLCVGTNTGFGDSLVRPRCRWHSVFRRLLSPPRLQQGDSQV